MPARNSTLTRRNITIAVAAALIALAAYLILREIVVSPFAPRGSPIHLAGGSWHADVPSGDWNGGFQNHCQDPASPRQCSAQSLTNKFQLGLSGVNGGTASPSANTSGWQLDVFVKEAAHNPAVSICTSMNHMTCADTALSSHFVAYVVNDPRFTLRVTNGPASQSVDLMNSGTCPASDPHHCVTVTSLNVIINRRTTPYICSNGTCEVRIQATN